MDGLRLAISWLTVFPLRGPDRVDRAVAGRAIALAPLVGVLLGAGAATSVWLLVSAGASTPLAGLLAVAALAAATRGMHLDGLADTMDGLGSYGPPERAREIMKGGAAGPFGVAAIVFAVGVQALSFAAMADAGRWYAIALAVAVGRTTVVLACRRGAPAAPGASFGALVAGTQSPITGTVWTIAAVLAALVAAPDRPWLGPVSVLVAAVVATVLVRHTARRFGGLSGDVLGAVVEMSVTVTAVGFALGA